ncbi:hypothetical protein K7432_000324 [Basidiobolus ranarum]|uniref:Uncharacterized protein n=1 Tax=Basidiobolus ranarum TaxID=34480 RepID=A0ABR2WBC5_9FUNG
MAYLSVPEEARRLLNILIEKNPALRISKDYAQSNIKFEGGDLPMMPGNMKSGPFAGAAFAALGAVADQIAQLRFGTSPSQIKVDTDHASYFLGCVTLFSADGKVGLDCFNLAPKWDGGWWDTPMLKESTAIYKTKDGRFFQLHGDLDASILLKDIGLDDKDPKATNDSEAHRIIGDWAKQYTADELEALMIKLRHSGSKCYEPEEWLATPMGQALAKRPLFDVRELAPSSVPIPFPTSKNNRILEGIKVVEMVRVIAGPTIGRTLAEFGAQVIKVNPPHLRDITGLQFTLTAGKHTIGIDARKPEDKAKLESLVAEADVFVNGFRPGSLERLGFGKQRVLELVQKAKGKDAGIVYVDENCYGLEGPYNERPGWQQIADASSGVNIVQGRSLGYSNQAVLPPLPIADLRGGVAGAISTLIALRDRAIRGGSYNVVSPLTAVDMFLVSKEVGLYPPEMVEESRKEFQWGAITPQDSVLDILTNLTTRWAVTRPDQLDMEKSPFFARFNDGPFGSMNIIAPVTRIDQYPSKWDHPPRPYCYDQPTFDYE